MLAVNVHRDGELKDVVLRDVFAGVCCGQQAR